MSHLCFATSVSPKRSNLFGRDTSQPASRPTVPQAPLVALDAEAPTGSTPPPKKKASSTPAASGPGVAAALPEAGASPPEAGASPPAVGASPPAAGASPPAAAASPPKVAIASPEVAAAPRGVTPEPPECAVSPPDVIASLPETSVSQGETGATPSAVGAPPSKAAAVPPEAAAATSRVSVATPEVAAARPEAATSPPSAAVAPSGAAAPRREVPESPPEVTGSPSEVSVSSSKASKLPLIAAPALPKADVVARSSVALASPATPVNLAGQGTKLITYTAGPAEITPPNATAKPTAFTTSAPDTAAARSGMAKTAEGNREAGAAVVPAGNAESTKGNGETSWSTPAAKEKTGESSRGPAYVGPTNDEGGSDVGGGVQVASKKKLSKSPSPANSRNGGTPSTAKSRKKADKRRDFYAPPAPRVFKSPRRGANVPGPAHSVEEYLANTNRGKEAVASIQQGTGA